VNYTVGVFSTPVHNQCVEGEAPAATSNDVTQQALPISEIATRHGAPTVTKAQRYKAQVRYRTHYTHVEGDANC